MLANGSKCSSGGQNKPGWPANITRSKVDPERGLERRKTMGGFRTTGLSGKLLVRAPGKVWAPGKADGDAILISDLFSPCTRSSSAERYLASPSMEGRS